MDSKFNKNHIIQIIVKEPHLNLQVKKQQCLDRITEFQGALDYLENLYLALLEQENTLKTINQTCGDL